MKHSMQLLKRDDISGVDWSRMPFAFLPSYEQMLVHESGGEYKLAFSEEYNALMPFKLYSVKGFKLLQPLFPPVTKNAEPLGRDMEEGFLNGFVDKVGSEKLAVRIIQSPSHVLFKAVPANSVSCPFGTYVVTLANRTEEEILSDVQARQRSVIRNIEKQGVEIKWGDAYIEDFYVLYKQTMDRSNMYCEPLEHFKAMAALMKDNVICGVVYWNNTRQGGVFIPYTQYGAFYLYGSSVENMGLNGAMRYLHWKAMLLLKEKGVKLYDFAGARLSDVSGTKLEGVQNFKKRFGAKLIEGFLWKADIDKVKCLAFDKLLRLNGLLHGRKPPKDIIDEENAKPQVNENERA